MINKLSVSFKMNLIVILPILCCALIFYRYSGLLKSELNDVQSIIDRYQLFNEFEELANKGRQLRFSAASGQQGEQITTIATKLKAINDADLAVYGLDSSEQNVELKNDMIGNYELLNEAIEAELEVEEIVDIASTASTSIITFISKQPTEVDNVALQNGMSSYITLMKLQEAASKESAVMALIKTTGDATTFRDMLIANKSDQQHYIDDYLNRYATPAQVDALLNVVTSESFQAANQTYQGLVSATMAAQDIALDAARQRENAIAELIKVIQEQTTNDATALHNEAEANYITAIAAIGVMLFMLIILGYLIGKRTLSGLQEIGQTLQQVEDKSNPSRRIEIAGSDEFATLGTTINTLIDARQVGERQMIEAKEEAERANEAKSIFLANMSHEMRTPLNGIIGMGKILSGTDMSGVQKGYLQTIQSSSKALLGIINDVLDISKIESNSLVIAPVSCDPSEHVDDVISMIGPKAEENNLKLILDYDQTIPPQLVMDDLRVQQIILNLMSNAVKFTEDGSVTLKVWCEPQGDDQIMMHYDVIDTGIGIAEDKIEKIFNPFEQEDASITRKFAGTGLGLTISKQLAELMGGYIDAKSTIGEGSVFSLHVPITIDTSVTRDQSGLTIYVQSTINDLSFERFVETVTCGTEAESVVRVLAFDVWPEISADEQRSSIKTVVVKPASLTLDGATIEEQYIDALINLPATPVYIDRKIRELLDQNTDSDADKATHTAKTILVVEDNPVNQQVASIMLEDEGFTVYVADNGQLGVDAWQEHNPDVILMDCMMPVMDGLTATETIRKIERENGIERAVPIIALTASTVDKDIKRCFEVGMNNYIPKPFELPKLLDAINKRYS